MFLSKIIKNVLPLCIVMPTIHSTKFARTDKACEFSSGSCMIPHPKKMSRGGEDACFYTKNRIGVFDGVSAWFLEDNIDAGEFAFSLSHHAQYSKSKFEEMLDDALLKTIPIPGSATACVLQCDQDKIYVKNIGDGGFLHFRDGVIINESTPQRHSENVPYQLGSVEAPTRDKPCNTTTQMIIPKKNDIFIVGTDGLFDNLTKDEITQIVSKFPMVNIASPKKLAWLIGFRAMKKKIAIDDITVVVSVFR
jgi:protein phosphatase PTC7